MERTSGNVSPDERLLAKSPSSNSSRPLEQEDKQALVESLTSQIVVGKEDGVDLSTSRGQGDD